MGDAAWRQRRISSQGQGQLQTDPCYFQLQAGSNNTTTGGIRPVLPTAVLDAAAAAAAAAAEGWDCWPIGNGRQRWHSQLAQELQHTHPFSNWQRTHGLSCIARLASECRYSISTSAPIVADCHAPGRKSWPVAREKPRHNGSHTNFLESMGFRTRRKPLP
ncbi:hypothetical protein K431DRAFT_37707 [Polychaeton citri CBS 116435]|uniref:Uncharacterized protein n=1 Tax=Polychaeton citri CBS 116435 TaxID=1314669 RepID=A0A9P4UJQ5_9PEZI|nr:hypothetical protein K431DRAFT_37707 [Polychaeton citri CBS 116435]